MFFIKVEFFQTTTFYSRDPRRFIRVLRQSDTLIPIYSLMQILRYARLILTIQKTSKEYWRPTANFWILYAYSFIFILWRTTRKHCRIKTLICEQNSTIRNGKSTLYFKLNLFKTWRILYKQLSFEYIICSRSWLKLHSFTLNNCKSEQIRAEVLQHFIPEEEIIYSTDMNATCMN